MKYIFTGKIVGTKLRLEFLGIHCKTDLINIEEVRGKAYKVM